MDLGKKLVDLRKKNKLTQEDFADKYHVTRQTVSSWENSKSYPDLETLVKISDDFSISLDKLLKEDKKMIKDISQSQKNIKKYKKIIIIFSVLISVAIIATVIYFAMYYSAKHKLEKAFIETVEKYDFYKNAEGYYTLDYSDLVSYDVPNQKVPIESGYNFHFFAQHLHARIELNDNEYLKITWIDYNYYDASLVDKNTEKIIINVGLLGYEDKNQIEKILKKIDVDHNLLKATIDKGNELYQEFYE